MGTLNVNELVDLSLNFLFYFTVGSFGASFKVLYESMTRKNYKIRLGKIIIGGGTTAILCAGLNYTLLHEYNIGTRFMIASVIGILGFEIFGKIKNITGLKAFISEVLDIINIIHSGDRRQTGKDKSTAKKGNGEKKNNDEENATSTSDDEEII